MTRVDDQVRILISLAKGEVLAGRAPEVFLLYADREAEVIQNVESLVGCQVCMIDHKQVVVRASIEDLSRFDGLTCLLEMIGFLSNLGVSELSVDFVTDGVPLRRVGKHTFRLLLESLHRSQILGLVVLILNVVRPSFDRLIHQTTEEENVSVLRLL